MKSLKTILLFIALLYTISSLAQERVNKGDIIIHISTQAPSISLGNDLMNIYKRGSKAEIVYRKSNRFGYVVVKADYDTTKVIVDLKTDTVYNKILQLFAQSGKQELETSIVGERHYLDGFNFSCKIITDIERKNIFIQTPMPETHPVVSALLNESYMRLFKKNYPY